MNARVLLVFAATVIVCVQPSQPALPLRAMILDGQSGGPYHAWQETTPVMKKMLEETHLFQVTVLTAPPAGGDFTTFRPEFSKYQVVISNYDGDDAQWPAAAKTSFEQYMMNGGGLVVVHAANNSFPGWSAYNLMIGIGGWGDRDEKSGPLWYYRNGRLVSDTSPGPAGGHGERIPFQVVIRDKGHPITRGLPQVWMHAADELYNSLRGPGQNMRVLATAYSDPANKGTGRDEPMLLALSYGKGRVFHTVMGHDVAAMSCVGFVTTFQRGTEWAATGTVTIGVPDDFPTADKVSTRSNYTAAGSK